jgi:hypothetical protein
MVINGHQLVEVERLSSRIGSVRIVQSITGELKDCIPTPKGKVLILRVVQDTLVLFRKRLTPHTNSSRAVRDVRPLFGIGGLLLAKRGGRSFLGGSILFHFCEFKFFRYFEVGLQICADLADLLTLTQ